MQYLLLCLYHSKNKCNNFDRIRQFSHVNFNLREDSDFAILSCSSDSHEEVFKYKLSRPSLINSFLIIKILVITVTRRNCSRKVREIEP